MPGLEYWRVQLGGVGERMKRNHLCWLRFNHLLEIPGCQQAFLKASSGHLGDGREGDKGLSSPEFDTVKISRSSVSLRDSACHTENACS